MARLFRRFDRNQRQQQRFFDSLGAGPKWLLSLAVFFTFGILGFVNDLWSIERQSPWLTVALLVVSSGIVAMLWLQFAMRARPWWVVFAIAFQMVAFPAIERLAPRTPEAQRIAVPRPIRERLVVNGLGSLLCSVLGYTLFVTFITGEGRRHFRLQAEVALAKDIHGSLAPPIERRVGRFEVFGRALPSSEVGGDLVDVIEHDGGVVACVADVSGHGVPAGTLMAMVRSALRTRLLAPATLPQVLDDVHRVVRDLERPDRFVTLAALRFDASDEAEVACAGHPPVLHVRAGGALARLDGADPPLGIPSAHRFGSSRVAYGPGDLFALYSDGLYEVADRQGRQLGAEAIERIVAEHAGRPLGEIHDRVLAAARAHGTQADDQTLLLVRVT